MDLIFGDFRKFYEVGDGYGLAQTLSPISPPSQPERLRNFYRSTNFQNVQKDFKYQILYDNSAPFKLPADEGNGWVEVYVAYWKAVGEIQIAEAAANSGHKANNGQYLVFSLLSLSLATGALGSRKYLRVFAIKADEGAASSQAVSATFQDDFNPDSEKNEKLEDAARQLNRIFNLCLSDRGDMPPLESFPLAHQVTFKYYVGVIYFLEENYVESEKNLTEAWTLCHKDSIRNKELILTYLIPCHLLTTHTLPTLALLSPYPRLQKLFLPLSRCIKKGDLSGFDAALIAGEDEFVKRRIYLTLERGRDVALRNLLRKVFIAGGFEDAKEPGAPQVRKTRVPVAEFGAAISIGSKETMDNDEVECLLANMIYKNLMKGYIARDRGIVVLSKGGAFPGTGV
ncbi:putative protein CSN12 like protein [Glarea lozoyensis 74030]|uniref:Protein CSN12 homolog n=1 Tax=Glarea lozoyensis (strain ATCC 74030 / MF5533) TaxID=1104152 RepID=H0EYT1_GLAL7|nr:putative protein CSN12 like protein [Glarea lozoyensis 74030]